jgi:hypothetical protein
MRAGIARFVGLFKAIDRLPADSETTQSLPLYYLYQPPLALRSE